MSTFKRIHSENISVIPYEANKTYDLTYDKLPNICQNGSDDDIKILTGQKISTNFVADFEPMTQNQYQKSVYNTINKLYYNKFSSSFDYDSNNELIKNFPSNENSFIRVIQIPQSKYGNNIFPNNFELNSDIFSIKDDGNGNLFDTNYSPSIHVGNIFYNQGLAIITNQDYKCLFPIEPTIFNKKYSFYINDVKNIDLLSDSISYCNQRIIPNTVELINYGADFLFTLSNGILNFTQNNVGTYFAQFLVKDSLNICSNIATIEIEIKDNCDFDLTISGENISQDLCQTSVANFELIRILHSDCNNYSNGIDGYLIDTIKLNERVNGIFDYKYIFNSNIKCDWSISIDGGLSYFDISKNVTKLEFTTELSNTLSFLKNSFLYILKLGVGESYTEYRVKLNPLTDEHDFVKIKEYKDINLIDKNCLLNRYKVVSNGCDITSINWSFTDEMSGVVTGLDEIVLLGCRGNVIAEIESRCCSTVTKVLTFNGNCIEPSCDMSSIDLDIYLTKTPNNYIIFANTNFYLKNYPNWKFYGNVQYLSNINSNFLEIQINSSDIASKISYEAQDFCKNLYSEHIFNKKETVVLTTKPQTTIHNTTVLDRQIPTADLSLNIFSNNLYPIKNEIVQINILIQNKGFIDATNIVIKFESDEFFKINDNTLLKYPYQKYDGVYLLTIPLLKIGEYFSIKFNGTILGNNYDVTLIKSEAFQVDQLDINSVAGNGYDTNEDDSKILKLFIKDISNTTVSTTFNCLPIVRQYPYSNYTCSIYGDQRGSIIISAINPFTKDGSDLEYSFLGDIDINYQENNISNLLSNGLYEVFIRLKSNHLCKTSTKIRVSCLNGQASTDWTFDGNICLN